MSGRCCPPSGGRSRGLPRLSLALALALSSACSGSEGEAATEAETETEGDVEPLRIAVVMPPTEDGALPNLEWAIESVNAAGGAAGRPLALDYFDPNDHDVIALAAQLAEDDEHVAVIGPPGSAALAEVADLFVDAGKPIISTTSTSDDLLRAYGGKGAIWRTRESDIAQTELLVRHARGGGANKIALLTSLDVSGYTFFTWFGFFARELGYPDDDVTIVTFESGEPCDAPLQAALDAKPEVLFVAPGSPLEMECVAHGLPTAGPRPRVMFADTGFDPYTLPLLGDVANGLEGFTGAGDEAFEAAFRARYPDEHPAPHGPSEYDAILLLAYGLERSEGAGGLALIEAMQDVVDGDGPVVGDGLEVDGIAATLAAVRSGERPTLHGASGDLVFEPDLYMDLASATFARYVIQDQELTLGERFSTDDPTFLTSQGAFVKPTGAPPNVDQSSWTPATPKTDTWALIAALSNGFSNYRHQADALQQYQLLRARGVPDDHIILIVADDLALDDDNDLLGVIRNSPGGEDVYAGAEIDYRLGLGAAELERILVGEVTATTPVVLSPSASSDVYIYLAGHGGTAGIPIGAVTAAEGLAGGDEVFTPSTLRASLCALAQEQRFRRAVVVIESCYAGVFGEAGYGGLEYGCSDVEGEAPLEGVALLTAANSREVSYAGAYDEDVPAWVNDAFSRGFVDNLQLSPSRTLADVYADTYQSTAGSHPSAFNLAHAGRLSDIKVSELLSP
ncbi:MAG: C13 family peptidase [Nannocystaceae bacterium]|nr:ABC transporter substrate-binding protein [Myxococcales bacterium]